MINTGENKNVVFITLLYFAMSLLGILHHELWLDEAHHWLLACDSNSLSELVTHMRHEGHPMFWNILLYLLTRITDNPFWMQFLHIILSTLTVGIFLRKSPFSVLFKILFVFGYFVLFEYNLISRNYILGILFLFLALSFYNQRRKQFPLYAFFLVLSANIHLMFTVISFALMATFIYENRRRVFRYYVGYAIYILGFALLLLQLWPSLNSIFLEQTHTIPIQERFTKGFISLFKGLITLPDFRTIHFWNSNLIVNYSKPLSASFGLLLYGLPLLLFYKRKTTLLFTYTALFGVQCFFFITQLGATRFDGINYYIILTALWIDHYHFNTRRSNINLDFLRKISIYFLLFLQFCSGLIAYCYAYEKPFSSGKLVAAYIAQNNLSNLEIVTQFCEGTIIAPYLKQRPFFLCTDSRQGFCDWELNCNTAISDDQLLALLAKHSERRPDFLFITARNITKNTSDRITLIQLTHLEKCIVRHTNYYIYRVTRNTAKPISHEKTIARF